jgi:hypothetical protein
MAALWALVPAVAGGQNPEKQPRSILPPGFDAPPARPASEPLLPEPLLPKPLPSGAAPPADETGADNQPPLLAETAPAEPTPAPPPGDAPAMAVGVVPARDALFAGSNGRALAVLAGRIRAPVASRWAQIILARSLLAAAPGPAGISTGDWLAARAGLLLRLGEAAGAARLVAALPVDRFTPALYPVAAQVALANADLAGLCPIAATGRGLAPTPFWDLALAMCAGMIGDDETAASLIDGLRRGRVARFDVRLGQRAVVMAGGAGRAEGISWEEEPGLTLYRYGVAGATGVAVPADRLAALGPAAAGWAVRNPALPPATRLAQAGRAAALGALSADELASMVAALAPTDAGGGVAAGSRAGRLRDAFTAGSAAARGAALAAIRSADTDAYTALLETAAPAARLRPDAALAETADAVIAALLAAGRQRAALAWWPVADAAPKAVRARAWALLATGSGGVPVTAAQFRRWRDDSGADARQAAVLLAALTGLGQAGGGDWASVRGETRAALASRWATAIAAAGQRRAGGEVALLAATGLQGRWIDVPPAHVRAITAALVATGRAAEARLFAAEAVTRASAA